MCAPILQGYGMTTDNVYLTLRCNHLIAHSSSPHDDALVCPLSCLMLIGLERKRVSSTVVVGPMDLFHMESSRSDREFYDGFPAYGRYES